MSRAVDRLKSKIKPDSVVMLFFGGYGVQVGRESYMIPVDAAIWKESDVRRDGLSVESVLDVMKEQGARAKLVVIDASRRNPYERRFRTFSHGLAPINAPDNALILSSATPGKVADDSRGQYSVLVAELLNNLNAQPAGVETVFNKTRVADLPRLRRRAGALGVVVAAPKTSASAPAKTRAANSSEAHQRLVPAFAGMTMVGCEIYFASALAVTGRTGSPSRNSAPARATTMSPSCRPSRISTWPPDINPTSTRRVSTRCRRTT